MSCSCAENSTTDAERVIHNPELDLKFCKELAEKKLPGGLVKLAIPTLTVVSEANNQKTEEARASRAAAESR